MHATIRKADDTTLASRYLSDQLSEAEREEFERRITAEPALVQDLETAARVKVGLASLRDSGQLNSLRRYQPPAWRSPLTIALAASAAVAVIAVALWSGIGTRQERGLMAGSATFVQASGLEVGSSYSLLRTRGTDYDAIVELPAQPLAIELRVRPESAAGSYRATLSRIQPDGSIQQVAAVADLHMESDRFVRLYVDSTRLEPGSYLLVLSTSQAVPGVSASAFRLKVLPSRNGS